MALMPLEAYSIETDFLFTATPASSYFGELPIYVDFSIVNKGSSDVRVWSVGRGSGAVFPSRISGNDSTNVLQLGRVSTMHLERMVRLPAGEKLIGRICISSWAFSTNGVTDKKFLPGDYSLNLTYLYGSNLNDVVICSNIIVHVVNPAVDLHESRENYRRICRRIDESTNEVTSLEIQAESARDCYSIAALERYVARIGSKSQNDKSVELWQKLINVTNSPYFDNTRVKYEIACRYLQIKRTKEARRMLDEIKHESDEAFGLLWILDKKEGPPID